MVPKRSDHYFDLLQFPEEAKEDALKQTMVNQEHMFRNQVQELHRVYQMQMVMMKNSRSKEMSETPYMNYSQDEYRGKLSQRLLNSEFPNGYYTNHRNERFIHKGNGLGTQEKPIDVECYFNGETKSRTKDSSLSLNIGGKKKSWDEKVTPVSSPHVINLEEPSGSFLKRENEPVFGLVGSGSSAHSGDHSYSHFISKGISINTKRSLSFLDKLTDFRGKSSLNQEYQEKRYEDLPIMNVSVVGETATTSKSTLWDLNEPPCDESPFDLNDQTGIHSPVSAAVEEGFVEGCQESMLLDLNTCIKPDDNSQHTPSSVLIPPSSNDNSTNGSSIDLESCGKVLSENSEDQECLTSDSQHKSEFGLKSSCRNSKAEEDSLEKADIDMSPISGNPSNSLKTMQSTSNSQHKGEFGLKSKADFDLSPISSNPSNSLKTMQSTSNLQHIGEFGLNSGFINSNAEEHKVEKADIIMSPISSIPSNTLKTRQSLAHSENSPVVNSIQSTESSQIESLGNENERSSLDDDLIRRGAVSLLFFMSGNSTTGLNHSVHENQPQQSLDSFESAVLKQQESKAEDFNDVSSNHFEVKDDEKDCPIKLRRGRRMKDFQKDILPSMASLSRHEICEDVRLMEGVIRSREYKRLRSKDSGDQKWFTPVKSRRSRLNNIGRRFYN